MRIDFERMLGNLDPEKPFHREPVRIKNRTGSMFVFTVGTRQFIAVVSKEEMRVTGDGIKETETLKKLAAP